MDGEEEQDEEEEAYYDGSGTGFYKYTGGAGAGAGRVENIMLALELPEVSSMRQLKKGSKGYRAAKRYRLVYPNSGKVREGKVERKGREERNWLNKPDPILTPVPHTHAHQHSADSRGPISTKKSSSAAST